MQKCSHEKKAERQRGNKWDREREKVYKDARSGFEWCCWMEFIRVNSNKWSKNQDLCTFIIKFSRLARLFFVTFSNEMQLFPSEWFTWSLCVCSYLWLARVRARCLGICICILIVSSVCFFVHCIIFSFTQFAHFQPHMCIRTNILLSVWARFFPLNQHI